MAFYLSPILSEPNIDINGHPLLGGTIETYQAGTTTPLLTAKDRNGSQPHAAIITLDANGLPPAPIWLEGGKQYRFVVKDAFGNQIGPDYDYIQGVNDVTSQIVNSGGTTTINNNASEWQAGPTGIFADADTYQVNGDFSQSLHSGRRVRLTVDGNDVYATILSSDYNSTTPGKTTVNLSNITNTTGANTSLTSGITATYYSLISAGFATSAPNLDTVVLAQFYVTLPSPTIIVISPKDGNQFLMRTAAGAPRLWKMSGDINLTLSGSYPQNTSLYVYLYDAGNGSFAAEVSTTSPTLDTVTKQQVKGGDQRRLLIAQGWANSAGNGLDTSVGMFINYYNQKDLLVEQTLTFTRSYPFGAAGVGPLFLFDSVSGTGLAGVKCLSWTGSLIHCRGRIHCGLVTTPVTYMNYMLSTDIFTLQPPAARVLHVPNQAQTLEHAGSISGGGGAITLRHRIDGGGSTAPADLFTVYQIHMQAVTRG